MKTNQPVNYEKALEKKKQMQKIFSREHSYPSSVLALLIAHFEKERKKQKIDWVYLFAYISICISTFLLLIYLSL